MIIRHGIGKAGVTEMIGSLGNGSEGSVSIAHVHRSHLPTPETDSIRHARADNIPSSNPGANEAFCHPFNQSPNSLIPTKNIPRG